MTCKGFQMVADLIERGGSRRSAVPILLRADFDASRLRAAAKKTKDGPQARRLLALATVYDGGTRTEAAVIGGVTLQIVRDWVLKFNAGGPEGLLDRKAPGQPSRRNDAHRAALAAMIESGPTPAIHGVVRWRLVDLCQWLWEEHKVTVAKQTLSRELRAMNYRKLSARPRHHAQAEGAIELFKKASPPTWTRPRARRASTPLTSRSGSATKPGSARRTS
jgi:transposase